MHVHVSALYKLLWTLFFLIQHVNKNPADDFKAYAMRRFKGLMGTKEFTRHLKSIG